MQLKLPSGITCEIRNIKGAEEDILASPEHVKSGEAVDMVLSACILDLGGSGKPSVDVTRKMLQCDRMYVLTMLRKLTYGDGVDFETTCPVCQSTNQSSISIEQDILPTNIDLAQDKNGLPVTEREYMTPSGKKCVLRMLTGREELALMKLGRRAEISDIMRMRMLSVDGKPVTTVTLKELDGADRMALRRQMFMKDAGLDTEIRIVCKTCSISYSVRLETQSPFLLPAMS